MNRNKFTTTYQTRLPFALLESWIASEPDFAQVYADRYGESKTGAVRLLWRARQDGEITAYAADKICIALGIHPVQVFGLEVWEQQHIGPIPIEQKEPA